MAKRGRMIEKSQRRKSAHKSLQQLPFQKLKIPYAAVDVVSRDEVEAIHQATLDVLETIGINFLLKEARDILCEAGATVKNETRVYFDRNLLEVLIAKAPGSFLMHARNPMHNIEYGKNNINFALVASPPNCSDLVNGRRSGTFSDFCDFIRLGQSLNIIHQIGGYPVEPADIAANIRYLEAEREIIRLSDKALFGYALGRKRIKDSIEMARIARGIDMQQLCCEPTIMTTVNANSPLQYDIPMLIGMIEMARVNQPVNVTPFTLAGAMAPATIAGAIVQQNAEALAGIAFIQAVNPGAPVFYGGFTSNVDMKTGAPAFGTPEYAKSVLLGGQLTRRYDIPYRSSNVNSSNTPDVQAAYESQMSLWPCIFSQCNLVKHACGWLEGGLCASFEKVIIDAEMLQMIAQFLSPVLVNDTEFGLDAMRQVGPGGHYFSSPHTLERYETAFYQPLLSDWRNFETWEDDNSMDATYRAHKLYQEVLKKFEKPYLEPSISDELDAFVEKRIMEGGQNPNEYGGYE